MPHLHELIDYVANAYIVYQDKVLLIHHRKYDLWLPIGGHIELDEDPEQALQREIQEECGLEVQIHGQKPDFQAPGTKPLYAPTFLDIHHVTNTHRHTALIYFATAKTDHVVLSDEHHDIRWFTSTDLTNGTTPLRDDIVFYAQEALKQLGTNQ